MPRRLVNNAHNIKTAEATVIGGGPAGLVSAIALAASGVETLLIAPAAEDDHRTTALLASSVTALATLGVWQACRAHAAPLAGGRHPIRPMWSAPLPIRQGTRWYENPLAGKVR